ncbi:MAG: FimV/HubP family polar landmark protein [Rhodoferax sp.]|uniref:FimV/HubP family polar landmark protein n=1 Tax=Rhodoferax sp. TaxID=50421 RepID=UPI002ACDF1CB|nr:FimV/HubP family polar landmark protein [Rhodoferax sp.]MDZ7891644.1 FimV/HubP family polar landmark protein [Rhodoferax sp.]
MQSALGEPLRAEVEIPEITAEEASSLSAAVAQPEAFTAAGLEYSPALTSLQARLARRADGKAYLRLTSDRAVNDPFVDLILEATWSSGRIVRDYTLLLDPPSLKKTAPAPTLAQIAPTPSVPATTPQPAPRPSNEAPVRPAPAPRAQPPVAATPPADKAPGAENGRITVKSGDTASKIAIANKPSGVSLDQMLVALLRSNPDAFVKGNLNRVRAGAVMALPGAQEATSISTAEASKTVLAQSKDFNEFRRNLAGNVPQANVSAADRKASGSIDTTVDEKKAAAPTPDKLTLSKGSVASKPDEAKIALEREAKDAAARAAELNKTISQLNQLKDKATPPPAASPAVAASTPTPTIAPAVPVAAVTPPESAASAAPTPAASAPVAAASVPAPVASEATVAAPPKMSAPAPIPTVDEPTLLDTLLEDPAVPVGAAGLLALLGGFGLYRLRQRKKNAAQIDSSFLESRLQPDSFFGASGGQRVDTNQNGSGTASSMVYSASQLDAADDVDPVAEADVYLAYGRDLQAEEILKEAVRSNPGRLAIHTKLLEIFAKRRDTRSFESTATQAFKLTGSESNDWARICEMGLSIDPSNPLYQPGGIPAMPIAGAVAAAAVASTFGDNTVPQSAHAELDLAAGGVDLDLDLDFSLDDEPAASAISDVTGTAIARQPEPKSTASNSLDMDFDLSDDMPATVPPSFEPVSQMPEISLSLDDLEVPLDTGNSTPMRFEATSPAPVEEPAAETTAHGGLMEFDLESLSMDLGTPAEAPTAAPDNLSDDPLGTKLALAEEFISIGDEDGARALIEEVVAEATGDMRAKAQKALAQLS